MHYVLIFPRRRYDELIEVEKRRIEAPNLQAAYDIRRREGATLVRPLAHDEGHLPLGKRIRAFVPDFDAYRPLDALVTLLRADEIPFRQQMLFGVDLSLNNGQYGRISVAVIVSSSDLLRAIELAMSAGFTESFARMVVEQDVPHAL